MKKFLIILLSFFSLAYSPCINSSQEEFQRRAQAAIKKLPTEDQLKIADIQRRAQAGEQLTFDDIDFLQNLDPKLIKIMQEDELAEAQQAQEQANDEKEQAKAKKEQAKDQLIAFRSQPQGPCPYSEKDDTRLVEIIDTMISLDEEIAAREINHRNLETTLACNDSKYEAISTAKSPYDATKSFLDGTVISLKIAGKNICSAQTGPENEFQIQATQSNTSPDEYEVTIDAYTVCDNLDAGTKPAHNNLARKLYQQIGKSHKEDSSTIQGSVEGTRYPGLITSCSDAQARFVCRKDLLTYLVKKRKCPSAPKRSWSQYAFPDMTEEEKAEQLAADLQTAIEQEKFEQDTQAWDIYKAKIAANAQKELQYYGSFLRLFSTQDQKNDTTENLQADLQKETFHRPSDLQELQEDESIN